MQYFIEDWFQSNDLFIATITDADGIEMLDVLYQDQEGFRLRSGRNFQFHKTLNNVIFIH